MILKHYYLVLICIIWCDSKIHADVATCNIINYTFVFIGIFQAISIISYVTLHWK